MDLTTFLSSLQDTTDVLSISDILVTIILTFLLSLMIAWVYRLNYKGVSYTQSYVHTLIMMSIKKWT